jgi:hypothetical protein
VRRARAAASTEPRPSLPLTPKPCASSIISTARALRHAAASADSGRRRRPC